MKKIAAGIFILSLLISCTFDYGEEETDRTLPDLVMINVEYVRVRNSDLIAKINAERVERYETQAIMKLENFSFEQYGDDGIEINAAGSAGFASVDIESVDISMDRGVRIEVESENIIIETNQLNWKDEQRLLFTGEDDEVNILRNDGTSFTGIGLRVDARGRFYEFAGDVQGTYVHEDDEDNAEAPSESEEE